MTDNCPHTEEYFVTKATTFHGDGRIDPPLQWRCTQCGRVREVTRYDDWTADYDRRMRAALTDSTQEETR
jgi:hypothetical protein